MNLFRVLRASFVVAALAVPACGPDSGDPTSERDASGGSSTTHPVPPDGPNRVAGSLVEGLLEEPYLGRLVFAWPRDCSVPVAEEVLLRSGRTADLEYNLGLRGEGQDLIVSLDDMTVVSVDGRDVPEAVRRSIMAQLALPSFLVDPNGAVLDLVGMEALIEQLESLDPGTDFEFTPEFAALVEEAVVSKYWGSWVGVWANWGSFEDAIEFGTTEADVAGDLAISDVEMESLGAVDEQLVALRSTITLDGADFARAVGGVMESAIDGDDTTPAPTLNGKRVVTVEIVTDPATLQPVSAFTSIDIELTEDGETQSQIEERRWSFDWQSADCD